MNDMDVLGGHDLHRFAEGCQSGQAREFDRLRGGSEIRDTVVAGSRAV